MKTKNKSYRPYKQRDKRYSNKPIIKKETELTVMKNSLLPYGCKYCEDYNFSCGHTVPIYEVSSVHSLNQLIGYAKFINKSFGDVYYRGECKLHDSLLLFRNIYMIFVCLWLISTATLWINQKCCHIRRCSVKNTRSQVLIR